MTTLSIKNKGTFSILKEVLPVPCSRNEYYLKEDETCRPCPEGTFNNKSQHRYSTCNEKVSAVTCGFGKYYHDSQCFECWPGTFMSKSQHRSQSCLNHTKVPAGCTITSNGTTENDVEYECYNQTIETTPINMTMASDELFTDAIFKLPAIPVIVSVAFGIIFIFISIFICWWKRRNGPNDVNTNNGLKYNNVPITTV